jgi:predicted alpha/beta hydrolase
VTRDFRSLPRDVADSVPVAGDGGVELVLYRLRSGARGGPVRLVGHCNGFAAGCYRDLLEAFAARGEDVFAFDQRGMGGADAPDPADPANYAPDRFALDLAAVLAATATRRPGAPLRYLGH